MNKSFSGILILTFACLSLAPGYAGAQNEGRTGLGLMIGEPTGISFKHWTSDRNAFDAGFAWSLGQYDSIHLHGDYLWHNFSALGNVEEGELPFYYGVGARVAFNDKEAVIGARVPVGISYIFEDAPLDLFLEVAPTLNLIPATDFDINGALGIRIHL